MTEYTLITSIGTGMYKKEGGYRETTYLFNDNKTYTTNLFYEAILKSNFKPIKKIIFVGTCTSSWDILIDSNTDEKLWENVYQRVSNPKEGLKENDELVSAVEEHLETQYNIQVKIFIHTDKIDFDTTEEIFKEYNSIIPYVEKDTDILFDITHGFRTMPILMYQTLQFAARKDNVLRNVELIYGEYIENEKISYVRDLSNYWYYARITDAISIFKSKLDGFDLSNLLGKEYEKYSKVIKKISDIVQTNFCLQIIEVLKQLKNTLAEEYNAYSSWFDDIKQFLEDFYKEIYTNKSEARILFNFARYLRSKNLNTQAVISLQLAVETACAEKSDNPEQNKGDYDFWQTEGKETREEIISSDNNLRKQILNLENFRNRIAHGGARNKNTKGFPMAENIPNIFDSGSRGVENFLKQAGL